MVFTMNTSVFAEEISADVDAVTDESAVEEIADFAAVDEFDVEAEVAETTAASANSANAVAISADTVLSENLATISENLKAIDSEKVGDYFIVYPRAIAFDGKNKPGSKKAPIKGIEVYKAKSGVTVSAGDLISDNKVNAVSFDEVKIKKVKIKDAKGATVDLAGKAISAKETVIKSIKLENTADNKALKEALKSAPIVIDVYPAYGGNDEDALKIAEEIGLKIVTATKVKEKNGAVKSIKVTTEADKKVTLKPTKKSGKYKGIADAGKELDPTDAMKAKGITAKYVILDGNFAGNFILE